MNQTGPGGISPGNYQPGSIDQAQQQWLWQYFGHTGSPPSGYFGENAPAQVPGVGNYYGGESQTQMAQQNYQGAANNAIAGYQAQGTSLSDQYNQLLQDTLGEGTVAMNTATQAENNYLGQHGILSQGGLGGTALSSAQLAVQQANQAAVGTLGYTEAQLQNNLAGSIASLQLGAAGTTANFPLQFGSLALGSSQLANALQVAQTYANAPQQLSVNSQLINPATGKLIANNTGEPSTGNANSLGPSTTPNPSQNKTGNNTNSAAGNLTFQPIPGVSYGPVQNLFAGNNNGAINSLLPMYATGGGGPNAAKSAMKRLYAY